MFFSKRLFREGVTMTTWKQKFNELKVGDKVRLIKSRTVCHNDPETCCKQYMGSILTITEDKNKRGYYLCWNTKTNSGCNWPKECLEKV